VLEYTGVTDVAVFRVSAGALAGIAWVVSFSTEAVGERLGSIFANALLVLGLVLVAGARAGGGIMRFHKRLPNDTATLLVLAVLTFYE
jgi:Ca2+/Na+ antiporter